MIGQFHRDLGNTVNKTDTSDIWKTLVQIALSYGLPIYFVAEIWKPALRRKLLRRMEDQGQDFGRASQILIRPQLQGNGKPTVYGGTGGGKTLELPAVRNSKIGKTPAGDAPPGESAASV
jgi:hypothetical protein